MFAVQHEGASRVKLVGRLDTTQAPLAIQALEPLSGEVTVDLSGLEYISSAGLGVFIVTHNRLTASGGSLALINPTDHIRHIFHLARLEQVLTIR
jgi:anti-anti-sigma factor